MATIPFVDLRNRRYTPQPSKNDSNAISVSHPKRFGSIIVVLHRRSPSSRVDSAHICH